MVPTVNGGIRLGALPEVWPRQALHPLQMKNPFLVPEVWPRQDEKRVFHLEGCTPSAKVEPLYLRNACGAQAFNSFSITPRKVNIPPPGLAVGIQSGHYTSSASEPASPDSLLRTESDLLWHGRVLRRWCMDCYSRRSYGGNFAGTQIDCLARHLGSWQGGMSPGEFDLVAEALIAACIRGVWL